MAIKILLIDDNEEFCNQAKTFLEARMHEVWIEIDGNKAYSTFEAVNPDIVVLDIALFGRSDQKGLEICREITKSDLYKDQHLGVILISAPFNSTTHQIMGLEFCAHEYLPKPFEFPLFETKIRRLYSMLPSKQQDLITVGNNIIIDRDSHTVIVDGKAVEGLTRLEFSVLAYLASPPNTVRSRYNMLEDVWKSIDFGFGVVDKCIFGIRSKISPDNRERFIGTVHKVGYKLKVDG